MTKAPFVLDHTTKNCPLEGVTIPAEAQSAVRQPSRPADEATPFRAATRPPFPLLLTQKVGVRTSHTTAAERLSSTPFNRPNAAFFGVMAERSDYCSLTPSCTSRSPISRVLWQHRRASLEVFVSLGVWPAVASKPTRTKNRIDGLLTALPRPARPTLRP